VQVAVGVGVLVAGAELLAGALELGGAELLAGALELFGAELVGGGELDEPLVVGWASVPLWISCLVGSGRSGLPCR